MSQQINQAVVNKAGLRPAVLVYDPAVEHVGWLLAGLDRGCSAVPACAADIYGTHRAASGSVHTIHLLGHGAAGGIFFENVFINGSVWAGLCRDSASTVLPARYKQ